MIQRTQRDFDAPQTKDPAARHNGEQREEDQRDGDSLPREQHDQDHHDAQLPADLPLINPGA